MKNEELLVLVEYAFGEAMCVKERKVEPRDLNQAHDQIVALIKKEVTEEFVEKWGRKLNPHRINDFEQMLKEAGVRVIESTNK